MLTPILGLALKCDGPGLNISAANQSSDTVQFWQESPYIRLNPSSCLTFPESNNAIKIQ